MPGKRIIVIVVIKEEGRLNKNALKFFIPVIWKRILFVA